MSKYTIKYFNFDEKIKNYIKTYNQFILIISGFSGSNKNQIVENINKDIGLKVIDYTDYINDKHEYTIDYINWDKINNDINKYKHNGIIIITPFFISNKMKFICDLHITFFMNKQKLRSIYEKTNIKKTKIVNSLIYPFYIQIDKQTRSLKIDISTLSYDEQLKTTKYKIQYFLSSKLSSYSSDDLSISSVTHKSDRNKAKEYNKQQAINLFLGLEPWGFKNTTPNFANEYTDIYITNNSDNYGLDGYNGYYNNNDLIVFGVNN